MYAPTQHLRRNASFAVGLFASALACACAGSTDPERAGEQTGTDAVSDVGSQDAAADEQRADVPSDGDAVDDVRPTDANDEGGDARAPDLGTPDVRIDANLDAATDADLTVVVLDGPLDGTRAAADRVTFTVSPAASAQCSLDDGPWRSCESPALIAPTTVGPHTVRVRAIAPDGAAGAPAGWSWTSATVFDGDADELRAVPAVPQPIDPAREPGWTGMFRMNCRVAKTSYDDPLRAFGETGVAHLSQFYGHLAVGADTDWPTLFDLPGSSCQGGSLHGSVYAVPAMLAPRFTIPPGCDDSDPVDSDCTNDTFVRERVFVDGVPAWDVVTPVVGNDDDGAHEMLYYSAEVADPTTAQPPPPGLRMVAGDADVVDPGRATSATVARFHCRSWGSDNVVDGTERVSSTIPACSVRDRVLMDVFFPGCWDGENLTSGDLRSHVAAAVDRGEGSECPASHPFPIVRPSLHLQYPIRHSQLDPDTGTTAGWRLASDRYTVDSSSPGGLSAHAVWLDGWHPEVARAFFDHVVAAGRDAHNGNLGNGYALSDVTSGSTVLPPIVNEGRGEGR